MANKSEAEDYAGETPAGDNQNDKESDKRLLATAQARFKIAEEEEIEQRINELDDLRFRAGDQWPTEIRNQRALEKRPCLTINRLPQHVQQITNEQRQNRPSIKVSPVDDNGDPDTAKIYQGLIRHIEYNSSADSAYDTAFDGAVTKGRGFFRILADYCDPLSFDQELLMKRILNSHSVYMDPGFQEADGSDMKYLFITDDHTPEEYKRMFPKSELASLDEWQGLGNSIPSWLSGKSARVAEYFYVEHEPIEIVLLSNGQVIRKSQLPEELPNEITIKLERTTSLPTVKWAKINGIEVLERATLPIRWIPIIPVFGTELYIDGKRTFEGIIRQAKDSQRQKNYWASAQTEMIALAPRAPFIGYEGQFEGRENEWAGANTKNIPFLQVKATTVAGQPAPLPQRNGYEPPIQAITQAMLGSEQDLKATTGQYDAALGNQSNETSGIAIRNRTQQAQTSNFHFVDNLSRSIRHAGRICVDWIPFVYDGARAVRIIGEEGEEEIVKINQEFEKDGQMKTHQMGVGKYDVTVEVGPSFSTRRQEAVQSMLDLIKVFPQAAQVAGDLLVKNMDLPGSKELAGRLKLLLPPGVAKDPNEKKIPIPPEIEQQLQQQGALIKELTEHLNGANQDLESKRMELESKERIEMAKLEMQAKIKMAELDSNEAKILLEVEIAELNRRQQLLNVDVPIGNETEGSADGSMSTGGPSPGEQLPTGGVPPGNNIMGG